MTARREGALHAHALAAARRRATRLLGRGREQLPSFDAYVVGYPKVGNTWFQVMLRMALVRCYELGDEWLSKVIYPQVEGDDPPPPPVPRILITHDMTSFPEGEYRSVRRDPSRYRGRPVVLLIRDPKDTLVSLYMQYVYREAERSYFGTANDMVRDVQFGLDKYLQFYRTWYRQRALPTCLMVLRYESMRADTATHLRRALAFLGLTGITDAIIDECVAFGSFENMRRMEQENTLGIPALAPSPHPGENAYKVRRGRIGGYSDYLTAETVAYIDRRVRRELPSFYGYPLGGVDAEANHRPLSAGL